MSCCKYILKNVSDTLSTFNFQKCDDALWYYEENLSPNEIKEIWCFKDSYSTQFKTIEILSVECDIVIPSRTPLPTPPVTPTFTPTPSSTPPVTPTRTIPVTPSNTPTSTPYISGVLGLLHSFPVFGDNVVRFTIIGSSNFNMTINWSDGQTTTYNGLSTYYPTHTFVGSLGIGSNSIITINGINYITNLDFSYTTNSTYNYITEFNNGFSQFTSLQSLDISNNSLGYFNTSFPNTLPPSLLYLYLSNNQISNITLSQPLPPSMYTIDVQYNSLTSFITPNPLPAGLTDLYLNNNPLTGFTQTNPLPITIENFSIEGCSLTTVELSRTINYMTGTTYSNGQNLLVNNQTTGGCVDITSLAWQQLTDQFSETAVNPC